MQKIIITTKEKKKKQLKEKNPFDNIKIMTLKELEAIYPYKYTEKTLDYIITNYHVLLDIAKIYLEQIIKYPVEKITGEKGEFLTKLKNDIDINILKEAINSTFTKRNSFEYLKDYDVIIDSIINNERIEKLWSIYSNKYKYAKCININEILNLLKKIIKNLNLII